MKREFERNIFAENVMIDGSTSKVTEEVDNLNKSLDEQIVKFNMLNEVLNEATKDKYACLMYLARKEEKEESYMSFQAPPDDIKFKLRFEPVAF